MEPSCSLWQDERIKISGKQSKKQCCVFQFVVAMFFNPNSPYSVHFTTTQHKTFVVPTIIDGEFSNLKLLSDKFNLLAVICLPRIIGSFFTTHPSRLILLTPVEMKGDRECVLENNAMQAWIRDSPCRTTFVPQSGPPQWQIFSFDRIYGNLLSFLEPNKNTSRKTMANTNGSPNATASALLCLCCMHYNQRERC